MNGKTEDTGNDSTDYSFTEAGRLGGLKTLVRYGRSHFQDIGRKGGTHTRNLHGHRYSEFGKLGGRPKRIEWPGEDNQ